MWCWDSISLQYIDVSSIILMPKIVYHYLGQYIDANQHPFSKKKSFEKFIWQDDFSLANEFAY